MIQKSRSKSVQRTKVSIVVVALVFKIPHRKSKPSWFEFLTRIERNDQGKLGNEENQKTKK
jgi:hypothetical protein